MNWMCVRTLSVILEINNYAGTEEHFPVLLQVILLTTHLSIRRFRIRRENRVVQHLHFTNEENEIRRC